MSAKVKISIKPDSSVKMTMSGFTNCAKETTKLLKVMGASDTTVTITDEPTTVSSGVNNTVKVKR